MMLLELRIAIIGTFLIGSLVCDITSSTSLAGDTQPNANSDLAALGPIESDFVIPAMWEYTAPLISPEQREREPSRAQKDDQWLYL